MKVLLIKNFDKLGKEGDIKDVKSGYGHNFLIKKGFAKIATEDIIKEWREEEKKKQVQIDLEKEELVKNKSKLDNKKITIIKKLAPVGIQGSVGKEDISKSIFAKFNIDIDKKNIELKKAIKSVGISEVDIKLGLGIHVVIRVEVVGEEVKSK